MTYALLLTTGLLTFRSLLSSALNNAMPLHSCPATGAELAELPEALRYATVRAFDCPWLPAIRAVI